MIDYWKLAKEFTQGDCVQKLTLTTGYLSPYVGTVTAVHVGLGVVDVQWPFGNERCFPDDIVRVNSQFMSFMPPVYDQSYRSYDIDEARKASAPLWRTNQFQPDVYIKLAKAWHKGASEVIAYDDLYRSTPNVEDEALRDEVAKFYSFAANAGELRIQQHIQREISKNAAYWIAQNRQYRATGPDIKAGRPACPRCSSRMKKSTYKMNEGARHKVFACPKCLYLIDPQSVLGPTGEPHDWFGTGGV